MGTSLDASIRAATERPSVARTRRLLAEHHFRPAEWDAWVFELATRYPLAPVPPGRRFDDPARRERAAAEVPVDNGEG